jgi:hypothetical protein
MSKSIFSHRRTKHTLKKIKKRELTTLGYFVIGAETNAAV